MKNLLLLAFLGLAFSCQTSQVSSDFDPAANFKSYQTFSVCLDDFQIDSPEHAAYYSPTMKAYFKDAIESEMKKFYTVRDAGPDLRVGLKILVRDKTFTYRNCDRPDNYHLWPTCRLRTYEYSEGTLVIYVADVARNQVIWQASITGMTDENLAENKKVIVRLVEGLFKKYPLNGNSEPVMQSYSETKP